MKTIGTGVLLLMISCSLFAQTDTTKSAQSDERGYFAAYEFLEMTMNNFQNFAGEAGYRFDDANQVRLTIMEVKQTERHLSNKYEAMAIDGGHVRGYFRDYEINCDRYFANHFYFSANISYVRNIYEHTQLDARVDHTSLTVGTGIGYTHGSLFGIDHLFVNFSIPVRYYLNHLEETKLGNSTVRPHIVVNNIWLFLGYKF